MTNVDHSTDHPWSLKTINELFALPFNDLLFKAHKIHRTFFHPNKIQISTLLSIKTGACPEDCKYCPQSGHYNTNLKKEKLIAIENVIEAAKQAKKAGATRFCMGAAWKNPPKKDFSTVLKMIKEVKSLGLETCVTLGSLDEQQALDLKAAGLDYYNHNLDTSPDYYHQIITTRTYSDRLQTLKYVRETGINVCCGGILGMGETRQQRASLLMQLANMPTPPESVPINRLIRIKGTPLESQQDLDPFEFIRCIAVARIIMPKSYIRLSAGRSEMNDQTQALAFFAGANSLFFGEKLLTAKNPDKENDHHLFNRLGLIPEIENQKTFSDDKKSNVPILEPSLP